MFNSDKIIAVTAENFEQEVLNSDRPVAVDFWGTTCVPCKILAPKYAEAADNHPWCKFVSIHVDENKELVKSLGLRSVPTFRMYVKGEVGHESIGMPGFAQLTTALNAMRADYISQASACQKIDLTPSRSQLPVEIEPDENAVSPSDLDKTKALFDEFQIPYEIQRASNWEYDKDGSVHLLVLTVENSPKVVGYSRFQSQYHFDRNGKFMYVGIWE